MDPKVLAAIALSVFSVASFADESFESFATGSRSPDVIQHETCMDAARKNAIEDGTWAFLSKDPPEPLPVVTLPFGEFGKGRAQESATQDKTVLRQWQEYIYRGYRNDDKPAAGNTLRGRQPEPSYKIWL